MKQPKKDLPKVFVLNAIIITTIYVLYFTAITFLMPAQEIIAIGDAHVGIIANNLFGPLGFQLILTAVVISVIGTLNGNIMGGMRYAQALGEEGRLFNSEFFAKMNKKTGTALNGAIFISVSVFIAFILYYIQSSTADTTEIFSGIAFDDLPIALNSMIYVGLFIAVVRIGMREKSSILKT